eukprot:3889258-Alexandrium_andersonii.AAC.1
MLHRRGCSRPHCVHEELSAQLVRRVQALDARDDRLEGCDHCHNLGNGEGKNANGKAIVTRTSSAYPN